jgi:hypothetical protein
MIVSPVHRASSALVDEAGSIQMADETLIERALAWLVRERGDDTLRAARAAFEERTGAIRESAPDYESRIAHFLEQYVCEGDPAPLEAFARDRSTHAEDERDALAGLLRSHRSLFVIAQRERDHGVVRDCIGGGHFRVVLAPVDAQLTREDYVDGRLISRRDGVRLSVARVHHPRSAHASLSELLAQVDVDAVARDRLLDALLSMRSRYLEFSSMRPELIYQSRALSPVRLPMRSSPA